MDSRFCPVAIQGWSSSSFSLTFIPDAAFGESYEGVNRIAGRTHAFKIELTCSSSAGYAD
jgi:hypothetical protein